MKRTGSQIVSEMKTLYEPTVRMNPQLPNLNSIFFCLSRKEKEFVLHTITLFGATYLNYKLTKYHENNII
jgi:hypothetical protein